MGVLTQNIFGAYKNSFLTRPNLKIILIELKIELYLKDAILITDIIKSSMIGSHMIWQDLKYIYNSIHRRSILSYVYIIYNKLKRCLFFISRLTRSPGISAHAIGIDKCKWRRVSFAAQIKWVLSAQRYWNAC